MRSRRFPAWQKVAALLPLLLLALAAPAQSLFRCRMDGLLRTSSCCLAEVDGANSGPLAKAQDCCAREVTDNQRPIVEPARTSAPETAWAAIYVLAVRPAGPTADGEDRAFRAWNAHQPFVEGPPIVLAKHAVLI